MQLLRICVALLRRLLLRRHTEDLEARIAAHQAGTLGGYTSHRRPVTLVFAEAFPSRVDALEQEHQIKGWSRQKKTVLVANDWAKVVALAQVWRSKK